MYKQYIKEREGLDTIETDKGFICYRIEFPTCFINDYFVMPKHRLEGHGYFLADQVFEICKGAGVQSVFCQSDERALNHEISRYTILRYGFEEFAKKGSLIFYKMDVEKWEKH